MFHIPIILNNRNRLTTTRNLADNLTRLGYTNITILDNDSTYPPLQEWYNNCPYRVVAMGVNHGSLALWNSGILTEFPQDSWVAYSDSDIELNPQTPPAFIDHLIKVAERFSSKKVGLALKIDDLPTNNEFYNHTRRWGS